MTTLAQEPISSRPERLVGNRDSTDYTTGSDNQTPPPAAPAVTQDQRFVYNGANYSVKLNPSGYTSTTGEQGLPIPNWVPGSGENIPYENGSIPRVTIENTPISPQTASEISRVIAPGGEIRIVSPASYSEGTQRVIDAVGSGITITQTTVGEGSQAMTTTIIQINGSGGLP